MPGILSSLFSALAPPALKWGLALALFLATGAAGFIWGENRALSVAAAASAKDADARVAAVHKSDEVLLNNYLTKLSAQAARGDALSATLAWDDAKLAADTKAAQEKLSHALPQTLACDLSPDAVVLLGAQPARH